MFDLLGNLFQWFGAWIPRVVIVPVTHAGVKFRRGKVVVRIEPGVCIYWPLLTEISTYPVVRQTFDFESQSLMTKDSKPVVISATVVGEIHDIVVALSQNFDVADTIADITRSAIAEVVFEKTFDELCTDFKLLLRNLTTRVKRDLKPYGVTVIEVRIMELSSCQVLKHLGIKNGLPGL